MHHPRGAPRLFCEEQIKAMVLEWQSDQRTELLNEILLRTQPLITGVLLSRSKHTEDFDELLNTLRIRIWKKLPKYDSTQGRIFSYFTLVCHQAVDELWAKRRLYQERYMPTSVEVLDHPKHSSAPEVRRTEVLDDLHWRIFRVQTVCTDEHELQAQRWLVKGLLDAEFKLYRHEAADAMTVVFGISPARARQIHDGTLLEIRRELLPITEIPRITTTDLCGTRQYALGKYANRLEPPEFSKLVFLMRNLAPAIIPKHERIDLILDGFPGARRLFDCG